MSVEEISRLLACTPADKEERVLSFIESQKRFYPFRVSQGPAGHPAQLSILSTNPRRVTLEAPSSKNVLVSGFATPVLKPRASNFHQDSSVSTSADHNSNSGHQKKAHTAQAKKKQNSGHGLKPSETKRARRDCTLKNSVEHRGAVKGVNISNKVSALPVKSSKGIQLESKAVQDDEIVARLAERRERRRKRRAIMKAPSPPAPVEAEESNTSSNEAESTPPRKKHRKPAIPLGVALMHGFSATNVGRNRLTLKPVQRVGLYSKGKASEKTSKGKGRKVTAKFFDELEFLNQTRTLNTTSQGPISENEEPVVKQQRHKITNKIPHKALSIQPANFKEVDSASSNSASSNSIANIKKPSGSEVWAIERGKSLPSGSEIASTVSGTAKRNTVVMDVRVPSWNVGSISDVNLSPPIISERLSKSQDPHSSSSSLSPWQSASQCGIMPSSAEQKRSSHETVSRFFAQPNLHQSGNPETNVNDPLANSNSENRLLKVAEQALSSATKPELVTSQDHNHSVEHPLERTLSEIAQQNTMLPNEGYPSLGKLGIDRLSESRDPCSSSSHSRVASASSLEQALLQYEADDKSTLHDHRLFVYEEHVDDHLDIEEDSSHHYPILNLGYEEEEEGQVYLLDPYNRQHPFLSDEDAVYGLDDAMFGDVDINPIPREDVVEYGGPDDVYGTTNFPTEIRLEDEDDVCTYEDHNSGAGLSRAHEASNFVYLLEEDEDVGSEEDTEGGELVDLPSPVSDACIWSIFRPPTVASWHSDILNFTQGQALLQNGRSNARPVSTPTLEEDLARRLRGHWTPQKL